MTKYNETVIQYTYKYWKLLDINTILYW